MNATSILLREARVGPKGLVRDVLLTDGLVADVAENVEPDGDVDEVVLLGGRHLLPGLWDNHVHFDQWTLATQRLDLSPANSAAEVATLVRDRLRTDPPVDGQPLVGFGFRDGLWPDRPHRDLLDAVDPTVPIVMVSGDLHCCWVNSAAARQYGHDGHPTGLLVETDWYPISEALRAVPDDLLDAWTAKAAAAAARRGVVGVADLEMPFPLDTWVRRVRGGIRSLRVRCAVWPSRLDEAIERGLRTSDVVPDTGGLVAMGALKVLSDGSLNTRTAYCHAPYAGSTTHGVLNVEYDELVALMKRAWAAGIESAIHAIGDQANKLVLDAFAAVGARGSVEHAQLLDADDLSRFAELGVVASVQPEHALDDRDVADQYWDGRTSGAYAFRGLVDAGGTLALGSDAPVAPLDPWVAIAAAVSRTRDDRPSWHPEQEIPVEVALASSAGGRTTVQAGDPADLVVVDLDPYRASAPELRAMPVAGTLLGGRWTQREGV